MTTKVLITGGAGYLAGFVVEQLQGQYDLTLMDRMEPRAELRSLPFLQGDITQYADVERACAGQDVVVHLVALVRDRFDRPHTDFINVMVQGTWNVAEACARQHVKQLINISSVVANGWPPADVAGPARVDAPAPFAQGDLFYALAKHLGEQIVIAYHQAYGLRVINLRPGVIANDGLNRDPTPPQDGRRYWFAHVDPRDVAQAIRISIEADHIEQGTYQIVAGREDALFDWRDAATVLGYAPEHNWPDL